MIVARDPSINTRADALLHPALPALWAHRVAHALFSRGHRQLARAVAYLARAATGGIEIHPGARLGRRVFIDHGAATVIGETAEIGDDVTIFHQVTLGAVGWWRDDERPAGSRRHPVIGDRVVICAGATVLGPVTIGDDVLIGAAALVLSDVPDGAKVLATVSTVLPRRVLPATTGGNSLNGSNCSADAVAALRSLASAGCW